MEKVREAIKFLASKIKGDVTSEDALKLSQAALNLANCEAVTQDPK